MLKSIYGLPYLKLKKLRIFFHVDPYLVSNTENPYLLLNMESPYFIANNTEGPILTLFKLAWVQNARTTVIALKTQKNEKKMKKVQIK